MLARRALEKIIPILRKDCRRVMHMQVEGFPRPYYCSFLLRDIEWFNTWASSGSVYRRKSDRNRNCFCDIRVGSYRLDQVRNGGVNDNDEEAESYNHCSVPIDDRHYDGLRLALWRLSEAKFREVLTEFNNKETASLSTVDPNHGLPSFTRLKRTQFLRYQRPERVDEDYWVRFCKIASRWMSTLPQVSASWVEFDASQESKVFVNTEGSIVVQHSRVFSIIATFRKLTKEGANLEQELVINVNTQDELPSMRRFKQMALKKYQQLLKLVRARQIHAFSGPVLLCAGPAGLLFHEAIGHRLEGSRLLASGEGQTFKGQQEKRVLNVDLSIRDDPTLRKFQGVHCIGSYKFDDEGSPARNALLIENGVLKGFLNTRAALVTRRHQPNGHARNQKHQRPISRMAVTIIEGRDGVSYERLKELLVEEIIKQDKPFGMIVYETSGGETETTSYDFQAFAGEISLATLIYPDGREESVRGVNFVGTPLQALNNIIAVGSEQMIDNGYCGAESGFIPITTISPAVLLSNLELQAKDEELVTQFILPRPKLSVPKHKSTRPRRRSKGKRRKRSQKK